VYYNNNDITQTTTHYYNVRNAKSPYRHLTTIQNLEKVKRKEMS